MQVLTVLLFYGKTEQMFLVYEIKLFSNVYPDGIYDFLLLLIRTVSHKIKRASKSILELK